MYWEGQRSGIEIDPYYTLFLEEISQKTKLSAFLGIRSGLGAIIVDKVEILHLTSESPLRSA